MFLITGARGAVATHLADLLHRQGLPVRLGSARPDDLAPPDGVEAVRLDLTDPADFPAALAGVGSVFLYARPEGIADFVDHAVKGGVEHIVLLSSASVAGADAENDPLARSHLDVERALLASPLTTTVLRPGAFASNAGAWAWPIRSGQPISLPYPGAHSDPLHERDIAEAAHAVLTDPRHRGGHFTLSGPESLTFAEQIDQLAAALGRPVAVRHVTREQWKEEMSEYLPGHYADALLNWWESNDGKPVPLTEAVAELTGHPARPFTTWAADHVADFG
ncbi:NmrA family protein [Streptomyces davaonensis JCM 4913]|uniref:NmrA family protein n=1 Tax=Streptomyces davaonensis (strain DSM 101723 / JCM 4913 / KCC S-0913 / 768) TaxID=1214101 RepID=K4R2C6_STRDJ|nr:NAD(P)H-binding protein [Streptomyces davaonensis]CCK27498.1 NmrA family protein [Streptomyces davaonensis JCM 4913]